VPPKLERLPIVYNLEKGERLINAFNEREGKFDDPYFEFIDICLNNLTWAVYHILMWQGRPLQLAPFQSVILETLWNKTFPILLASRGASKTFMLAVYAVMRAILTPGSKVVIVAASFRQSKLVFEYIEQLFNYSPLLRACCPTDKIEKPADKVQLKIGTSVITALPLGNGEKIRGIRACVSADTLIDTESGLIPAKEIVESNRDWSIYTSEGFETPKTYCRTNLTDVHEVETICGFKIQFSDIHRIYTDDGWKDIDTLTTDDRLCLHSSRTFPVSEVLVDNEKTPNERRSGYNLPETVNQDVARLLGYLISEGSTSNRNGTISFTNTDADIIRDYCATFERVFNVKPAIYQKDSHVDKRGWDCKKSYEAKICRLGIRKYLERIGLDYLKAQDKTIPWCILRSTKPVVTEFLKTLFESNGTAVLYRDSRRDTDEFYIAYYSASNKLCAQLQVLLLKYGLIGSLSRRSKCNVNYHLRLTKKYAAAFAKDVGFISSRKTSICKEALVKFKPKYYDGRSVKIKKIKKCVRKDILYDVCMPETHKFVGNGIVNHNTHILVDEYASINPEVFQVVVRGFASVSANPIEAANQIHRERQAIKDGTMTVNQMSKRQGNQIVYSGTANFQFNHFHKLYQTHKGIIDNRIVGDSEEVNKRLNLNEDDALSEGFLDYRDYAIVQIPYQGLPEGFMDEKQIAQAKVTMPKSLFQMEYECKFPTDSDGFYKKSLINSATPGHSVCGGAAFPVEVKGQSGFEYVMGVDPARKTDNFAISVLKLLKDGTYKNVYCYSMKGKKWPVATRKVREILEKFNIVRIAMDAGGGGTTVEDLLQDDAFLQPGEKKIWRFDDDEHKMYDGIHILDMVDFAPKWIRDANYDLAADIEHRRLLFPYRTPEVSPGDFDEFEAEKDDTWDEIDEQIKETCMITVTATKTGIQHFDIPELPASQQSTLKTYQRKDRYSALLLASYAARSYLQQGQRTIQPSVGGWI